MSDLGNSQIHSYDSAAHLANGLHFAAAMLIGQLNVRVQSRNYLPSEEGQPVHVEIVGLTSASIVQSALSVEIIIKALIGKTVGVEVRSHHHLNLFKNLPLEVQEDADKNFSSLAKLYNQQNVSHVVTSIYSALEGTSRGFEEWRYMYEPRTKEVKFSLAEAQLAYKALARSYYKL